MTVQDDERERELVRLFNLAWDPAHQRAGVDATLQVDLDGRRHTLEVEVKSTTGDTVSTARDVGMDHIHKWRNKLFVIGFYSRHAKRPELLRSLCLTPTDMAQWIDGIEAKVAVDFRIAECASSTLTHEQLWAVCGKKVTYSIADARAVLRQQWTAAQYEQACDTKDDAGERGLSAAAMLQVVQARARYIAQRGATLNNPHITKSHLAPFFGTDREVQTEWASRIRVIAVDWLSGAHQAARNSS